MRLARAAFSAGEQSSVLAGVSALTLSCSSFEPLAALIAGGTQHACVQGRHAMAAAAAHAAQSTVSGQHTASAVPPASPTGSTCTEQQLASPSLPLTLPAAASAGAPMHGNSARRSLLRRNMVSISSLSSSSMQLPSHWQFASQFGTQAAADDCYVGREAASYAWSELDLLTRLHAYGLQHPETVAVHKAWQDGLHKHLTFHRHTLLKPVHYTQQQSPLRLLARVRRLLRVHGEAADVAKAELEVPMWGQLDVKSLLVHYPGMLLIPPHQLGVALDELLEGVSHSMSQEAAIAYVQSSKDLLQILHKPSERGGRMMNLCEVYEEVVGMPAKLGILKNTSSSYMRFRTETIRARLIELVDRYGPQATHSMLSLQPHLLSSSTDRLLQNGDVLRTMMGLTDPQVKKVLVKNPRLLNTNPDRLRSNLAQLTHQFVSLDMNLKQINALLVKYPLLLTLSSVGVAAKLQALKELVGPFEIRLSYMIRAQPSILQNTSDNLQAKVASLKSILGCDHEYAQGLVAKHPSLLTSAPSTLRNRLEQHMKVLGVSREQLLRMVRADAQLLGLQSSNLKYKLQHMCTVMGWQLADLQVAIAASSRVLLYDSKIVTDYMQLITKLSANSQFWSFSGHGRRTPQAPATPTLSKRPSEGFANAQLADQGPRSSTASGSSKVSRRVPCWQVYFARNMSERMPLRMEYLVTIGQQEEVALTTVNKMSAAAWSQQYPDFESWAKLRLQALAADPSDWPISLVQRAVGEIAGGSYVAGGQTKRDRSHWNWRKAAAAAAAQQQQEEEQWQKEKELYRAQRLARTEGLQEQVHSVLQHVSAVGDQQQQQQQHTCAASAMASEDATLHLSRSAVAPDKQPAVEELHAHVTESQQQQRQQQQEGPELIWAAVKQGPAATAAAAAGGQAAEEHAAVQQPAPAVSWQQDPPGIASQIATKQQHVPQHAAAAEPVVMQRRRRRKQCAATGAASTAAVLAQQQFAARSMALQLSVPRAWFSVAAEPQQLLYQQQWGLADLLAAAAAALAAGAQQQQQPWQLLQGHLQQGDACIAAATAAASAGLQSRPLWDLAAAAAAADSHDTCSSKRYSSRGVCGHALTPAWCAVQDAGHWLSLKLIGSSSCTREEQLLSLSELLRQRSQQLAYARGLQTVAVCCA